MSEAQTTSSYLDQVDTLFGNVHYMRRQQANLLQDFIVNHRLRNLLELGTFHGKGTAYFASILEDRGGPGIVTTMDREDCLKREPNVSQLIATLGLEHRVDIQLHSRSFTMTLMHMLETSPKPMFDLCYIDGAHTWDGTGFVFLLIDRLLVPGGWVILDDLDWTIAHSEAKHNTKFQLYSTYSAAEKQMPQVRKVWEILVPELGYMNRRETEWGWGIARKPPLNYKK